MLDIGWPELMVILVVALMVIGPKDLPKAMYTVGKWVKAARKMTGQMQRQFDEVIREAELEEVRKSVQGGVNKLNVKKQIEETVDPGGNLKGAFDISGGKSVRSFLKEGGKKADAKADEKDAKKTDESKGESKPGSERLAVESEAGEAATPGAETSAVTDEPEAAPSDATEPAPAARPAVNGAARPKPPVPRLSTRPLKKPLRPRPPVGPPVINDAPSEPAKPEPAAVEQGAESPEQGQSRPTDETPHEKREPAAASTVADRDQV